MAKSVPSATEVPTTKLKKCETCGKMYPPDLEHFGRANRAIDGLTKDCLKCRGKEPENAMEYERPAPAAKITNAECEEMTSKICLTNSGKPKAEKGEAEVKIITIDLTDCPEVYERIERVAAEEERTIEAQVRWWLRKHMAAKQSTLTERG